MLRHPRRDRSDRRDGWVHYECSHFSLKYREEHRRSLPRASSRYGRAYLSLPTDGEIIEVGEGGSYSGVRLQLSVVALGPPRRHGDAK